MTHMIDNIVPVRYAPLGTLRVGGSMKVRVWLVRVWIVLLGIAWVPARAQTAKRASLSREATTILSQRCMECHGREPLTAGMGPPPPPGGLEGGPQRAG